MNKQLATISHADLALIAPKIQVGGRLEKTIKSVINAKDIDKREFFANNIAKIEENKSFVGTLSAIKSVTRTNKETNEQFTVVQYAVAIDIGNGETIDVWGQFPLDKFKLYMKQLGIEKTVSDALIGMPCVVSIAEYEQPTENETEEPKIIKYAKYITFFDKDKQLVQYEGNDNGSFII